MKYLFLVFTLSFTAISTHAQRTVVRKGFLFGAAVGASQVGLRSTGIGREQQVGGSFPNFRFGYMVGPKSAVVLSLPGSIYRTTWEGRERDRGFEGIVPTFQYWPGARWWVAAGAGLGMDAPAFYDIKEETERKFYFGGTGLASVGYEIWQRGRFALDLQLRAHFSSIHAPEGRREGAAVSVLLGVNWY